MIRFSFFIKILFGEGIVLKISFRFYDEVDGIIVKFKGKVEFVKEESLIE